MERRGYIPANRSTNTVSTLSPFLSITEVHDRWSEYGHGIKSKRRPRLHVPHYLQFYFERTVKSFRGNVTTVTLTRDETETKCKRYPVKIKTFQDFKNGGSGSITDLTFDLSTDEDQWWSRSKSPEPLLRKYTYTWRKKTGLHRKWRWQRALCQTLKRVRTRPIW